MANQLAEKDYMSGMKYQDIADKYGVSVNTVKSWKKRYAWERKKDGKDAHKSKKDAHKTEKGCTQKGDNKRGSREPTKAAEDIFTTLPENTELTENQRLFCLLYVKYRNKVKAYQKAFHCSYECACGNASALWKNIEVQKYINQLLEEYRSGIDIEIQDLFQWYLDIARADINDFISIKDNTVELKSEIDGMMVTEISNTRNGIKVKLSDRMKAMEWIGEHIDIASEKQKAELELLKAKKEALSHESEGAEEKLEKFFAALEGGLKE